MSQTILVFPRNSELRVVRRRLTQHDLDMYAAISGRKAEVDPADEGQEASGAEPAGEDPGPERILSKPQKAIAVRASQALGAKAWSPAVLGLHLRQLYHTGVRVRLRRPEMGDWLKQLSDQAMEKFQEAQARIAAANAADRRRAVVRASLPENPSRPEE